MEQMVEIRVAVPVKADCAVIVQNDSMSPTIQPGDYALIKKDGWKDAVDGVVLAINTEKGVELCRMRKRGGLCILSGDNPETGIRVEDDLEGYDVVGHVVAIQRAI